MDSPLCYSCWYVLGAVIKEVSSQSHLHWPRALFPSLASWRLDQPLSQVGTAQHLRPSFVTCSGFKTSQHCFQSCTNFGNRLWFVIVLILNFVMETSLQIWEAFPPTKSRSTASCPSRWVLAAASGTRVVSSMPISFRQEEVVSAFQSRCFSVNWDKFKFPLIEDLLLDPCFLAFRNWRQEHCLHQGLPAGPRVVSQCERPMFRMALGVQTGAGASGKAALPLIPFGLGADGHFDAASAFQSLGTPFEQDPLVDDDLLFAASQSAAWYGRLRAERERVLRVLKELSYRWQPVTDYLRSFQPWEVAKATAGRHLAMIGLLGILVDWPDSTFLHNLLTGFPSVGFSPHVASYTSQPATWIPLDEIWDSSFVDAARIRRHLRPDPLDTEIVKAGDKDESLGFCSEPFSWEHLLSLDRPFRLIRRFCIQQGEKCRVIDDANEGGQSALSSDANKLSALLSNQASMFGCWPQLFGNSMLPGMPVFFSLETGGEDLPNAYRHVPMVPEDSWASIVTYWDPSRAAPCFRRYFGLLFGLPNAVCSFNRFPRMLQCFFRRLGFCMASMYFDDLTVQDLQSNKGSSQQFCINLASLLGSAFSEEKHQPMQASADFLGLCHNVGDCHTQQGVTFWVRDRLLIKVNGYISDALQSGTLRPGVASKLFGCLTFLAQGCWGKVGRSGLQPLQDRQYSMDRDNSLTADILRSFLSFLTFFLSDLKDVIHWTFRLLPDSSLPLMQHRTSPDRALQERCSFFHLDSGQPLFSLNSNCASL